MPLADNYAPTSAKKRRLSKANNCLVVISIFLNQQPQFTTLLRTIEEIFFNAILLGL